MKTWNLALYDNGKLIGRQHDLNERAAAAEIYRLTSHVTTPAEEIEGVPTLETGELSIVR